MNALPDWLDDHDAGPDTTLKARSLAYVVAHQPVTAPQVARALDARLDTTSMALLCHVTAGHLTREKRREHRHAGRWVWNYRVRP